MFYLNKASFSLLISSLTSSSLSPKPNKLAKPPASNPTPAPIPSPAKFPKPGITLPRTPPREAPVPIAFIPNPNCFYLRISFS